VLTPQPKAAAKSVTKGINHTRQIDTDYWTIAHKWCCYSEEAYSCSKIRLCLACVYQFSTKQTKQNILLKGVLQQQRNIFTCMHWELKRENRLEGDIKCTAERVMFKIQISWNSHVLLNVIVFCNDMHLVWKYKYSYNLTFRWPCIVINSYNKSK